MTQVLGIILLVGVFVIYVFLDVGPGQEDEIAAITMIGILAGFLVGGAMNIYV